MASYADEDDLIIIGMVMLTLHSSCLSRSPESEGAIYACSSNRIRVCRASLVPHRAFLQSGKLHCFRNEGSPCPKARVRELRLTRGGTIGQRDE